MTRTAASSGRWHSRCPCKFRPPHKTPTRRARPRYHPRMALKTMLGTLRQCAFFSIATMFRINLCAVRWLGKYPGFGLEASGERITTFSVPSIIAVLCTKPRPLLISSSVAPGYASNILVITSIGAIAAILPAPSTRTTRPSWVEARPRRLETLLVDIAHHVHVHGRVLEECSVDGIPWEHTYRRAAVEGAPDGTDACIAVAVDAVQRFTNQTQLSNDAPWAGRPFFCFRRRSDSNALRLTSSENRALGYA
jgi:hypothetical protein